MSPRRRNACQRWLIFYINLRLCYPCEIDSQIVRKIHVLSLQCRKYGFKLSHINKWINNVKQFIFEKFSFTSPPVSKPDGPETTGGSLALSCSVQTHPVGHSELGGGAAGAELVPVVGSRAGKLSLGPEPRVNTKHQYTVVTCHDKTILHIFHADVDNTDIYKTVCSHLS